MRYFCAVNFCKSAADELNKLRSTATSAVIPIAIAGGASGANNEEWFDGKLFPEAFASTYFSGFAPPREK